MIDIYLSVYKNDIRMHQVEVPTTGCTNVVTCHFTTDATYIGLTRIAVFENRTVVVHVPLDENGTCLIPNNVLSEDVPFYIGLIGVLGNRTITTNRLKVNPIAGVSNDATDDADYSPTVLATLLESAATTHEIAATAEEIAASVREDADNGVFTPQRGVDYFTETDISDFLAHSTVTVSEFLSRYKRDLRAN